jgi:curved DNA-binding protein CbpA
LTLTKTLDAYAILQVDPSAHEVVIRAAYHALARRYHPDGPSPDPDRMADLNHAYDLIRDGERRRAYDERRESLGLEAGWWGTTPVGPGGAQEASFAQSAEEDVADHAGPFTRRAQAHPEFDTSGRLDFGRYAGWSIRDLAHHDPDYLRWLGRHSSGVRFRNDIAKLLPDL